MTRSFPGRCSDVPDEEAWVVETKAALQARLGEPDYDAAAGAGRVLSLTEAVTRVTLRVPES